VSPHEIAVRTADAYGWLAAGLTKRVKPRRIWSFCALCWGSQDAGLLNDFEAAVFPRHSRLSKIKRKLLQSGAADASLAGSGSAVFALFRSPAMARRAAQGFPQDQVFICDTVSRGKYRSAQ
jgi:4-diphosphocytidyl-2C-methyl-D-erythritol kinase